jgi:hypothetical protein
MELSVRTGLEVSFRLPSGASVRSSAILRSSRCDESTGERQLRLTFRGLDLWAREALGRYVDSMVSSSLTGSPAIEARIAVKYSVHWDAAGRLRIGFDGGLGREEAQELADLVRTTVSEAPRGRVRFQLDVWSAGAFSREVASELCRSFVALRKHGHVLGLLVGERSVAQAQLVRCVRDANLADEVFCADDSTQADEIWRQLER